MTCNAVLPRESYGTWSNGNVIHECPSCFEKRPVYVLDETEDSKICIICGLNKNVCNFNKPKLNSCDLCNSWYRANLARERAIETHIYRYELHKLMEVNKRKCTKCTDIKDLDLFYKSKAGVGGYESICIVCSKGRGTKTGVSNPRISEPFENAPL